MKPSIRHRSRPLSPLTAARHVAQSWVLVVAPGLLIGCSDSGRQMCAAGGKVTFSGGAPLTHGLVTFRLKDDPELVSARGQIQPDGTFRLTTFNQNDGAVVGKHQALVVVPVVESEGPLAAPPFNLKYSNFATSNLEFTVTDDPAKNQFEIIVTK